MSFKLLQGGALGPERDSFVDQFSARMDTGAGSFYRANRYN